MRKFLLGVAKWSTIGVTIFSTLTGISGIVLGVLPAEATNGVLDYLGQTAQNIQSMGYVAFGGGIIGMLGISGVKTINLRLKDSDMKHSLWEAEVEKKLANRLKLQEDVTDITVQKQNVIISNQEILIKQQNSILAFQAIQAQRSLSSELVEEPIKQLYRKELENLKHIDFNISPITKVVTETIEVVKETTKKAVDRL